MKKKTSTAVEAAKEIVRRNISAKQRAAEYLQLLSPAEVQALQETGELAADAADFSKQSARVSSQAQAADRASEQDAGRRRLECALLERVDLNPPGTRELLHNRSEKNQTLGSEMLYRTAMENADLMADGSEVADWLRANPLKSATWAAKPGKQSFSVKVYMLSRHSQDKADLAADDVAQDRLCSLGVWSFDGGNIYKLRWKELSDPALYSTYTELVYDASEKSLNLNRSGNFGMNLEFRIGKTFKSEYHTPYGDVPMITTTDKMEADLSSPQEGYVNLAYFLSNDNMSGHYVTININYCIDERK